jgi:hypothetical protein
MIGPKLIFSKFQVMLPFLIVAKITTSEGLFILKTISELACLIARPIIPSRDP